MKNIKKQNNHFLSLIIPVYKQEKTIRKDILSIFKTLSQIRYNYEVIVIVDGLFVDTSYYLLKKLQKNHPLIKQKMKLMALKKNYGKGYALRKGMAQAKGDYIAFIDAGMEIDPNGISMILEHMEWYNADIIVGSKRHPASQVSYPLDRKIVSFFAKLYAKYFLSLNITDTQAGLKIFRKKVLQKVLPKLLVKQYAFDLEILSVANRYGFTRIYEAPIKLNYSFESLTHANGLKILWKSLIDSLAVFYRLKILHYYDKKN
jgi:glycosyltransferase involved in cell wall biosynthesis